ncbi:IS701 family transposase [Streptomyces albidoflavus]
MTDIPFRNTAVTERGRAQPSAPAYEEVLRELCVAVFTSLPRRDQRTRAEQYVRGLLCTPGRKSIRNIAAHVGGGSPTEQRLHHFVTSSTWDWRPVRASLIRWLESAHPQSCWVVQPMPIPKSGRHSVGVGRRFDPHMGQVLHGQQSFGIWFVSPDVVTPVGWRLFLPDDTTTRGGETYEDSVTATVMETVGISATAPRPVVLDVRGIDARSTMRQLPLRGLPVLARVQPTTLLWSADPNMPYYGTGPRPAHDLLTAVKALRRPVEWHDDAPSAGPPVSLAAAVPVTTVACDQRQKPSLLLGEWMGARRTPAQFWMTNMRMPAPPMLRIAKEASRVSRVSAQCARQTGLRDFTGRSLGGWHRHLTLASVACAIRALSRTEHGIPALAG